jgi:hypothetical protein
MRKKLQTRFTFKRTIITVMLLVVFYAIFWGPLPFIRSWWDAQAENWSDWFKTRHRMADGLLLLNSLQGMHESEVFELLGTPPQTDHFTDWNLVYPLGQERGFLAIDSEWLVLRTDTEGKVIDAKRVHD